MRYFILFSSLVIPILSSHLCEARIIHLPTEYPTIQTDINVASQGDTVLVAPGICRETLRLKENVRVQGAGVDLSVIDVSADTGVIYTVIEGKDGAINGAKYGALIGFCVWLMSESMNSCGNNGSKILS